MTISAFYRGARLALLAVLTPLLEKNVVKTLALDAPVVFSMSRLIVLAFAVCVLHGIWRAGVSGWPAATLAMAVVLALPILSAMERVRPEVVVDIARTLIRRFGVGSPADTEPSKFDDHRSS